MTDPTNYRLESARFLVSKLERLSADSVWAHRASGLRGALLRWLEAGEQAQGGDERLASLLELGYDVLEKAAREIPAPENNS